MLRQYHVCYMCVVFCVHYLYIVSVHMSCIILLHNTRDTKPHARVLLISCVDETYIHTHKQTGKSNFVLVCACILEVCACVRRARARDFTQATRGGFRSAVLECEGCQCYMSCARLTQCLYLSLCGCLCVCVVTSIRSGSINNHDKAYSIFFSYLSLSPF